MSRPDDDFHGSDTEAPFVFVSYVREDSEIVQRLVAELRAASIEVWLDRDRLKPGMRWQDAIRSAIQDGMFFIACLSESARQRGRSYMREEMLLAIEELRQRPRDQAWFLPALLEPGALQPLPIGPGETLEDIQYVDLTGDWNSGIAQLLSVILPTPSSSPQSDLHGDSKPSRSYNSYGWSFAPTHVLAASAFPDLVSYLRAIFEDLEEPITDQGIQGLAARLRESEFVDANRMCRDDWPGRPSDDVLSKAFAAMHNEVLLRSSDIHERGWFFEDRW